MPEERAPHLDRAAAAVGQLRKSRRVQFGERVLLPVDEKRFFAHAHGDRTTLSVLSYHVLAQCHTHAQPYCSPHLLNWSRRRRAQLDEILGYGADVVCLQDVDNYDEWWRPQLSVAGYDLVHKRRTTRRRPREDGVLIAWRRAAFQLFRSEDLELNAAAELPEIADAPRLQSQAIQDNVALMVHLQPWEDSVYPCSLCVACAQLAGSECAGGEIGGLRAPAPADPTRDAGATVIGGGGPGDDGLERVRLLQTRVLARALEVFNADFQLPVVCGVALGDIPGSTPYEALVNGARVLDPGPPRRPEPPIPSLDITDASGSSSTIRVAWTPLQPIIGGLDPPTDGYWVQWRVGGNSALGWRGDTFVREVDATRYVTRYLPNGARRTIRDPQLHFTCCGLASGFAYEFRLAAVNALGVGPWSEPSKPIALTALGTDYERQVEAEEEEQTFLRDQEAEELRRRTEQDEINAARYAAIKRGDLDEAARIAAEGAARASAPRPRLQKLASKRRGPKPPTDPNDPFGMKDPDDEPKLPPGTKTSELYELAELERATAFMRDNITLPAVIRLCLDKGVGGDADELDRMRREVRDGEKTELHYLELLCAQLTDAGVARDEIKGAQKLMLRLSGIAGTAKAGAFGGGGAQLAVMEANDPALRKMHYYKTASGADPFQLTLGPNEAMPPSRKQRLHATGAMDMADGQALGARPPNALAPWAVDDASTRRGQLAAPGRLETLTPRDERGEKVVVGPDGKPKRAAPVSLDETLAKFVGGAAARAAEAPPDADAPYALPRAFAMGNVSAAGAAAARAARDPTLAADAARAADKAAALEAAVRLSQPGVDGGKDANHEHCLRLSSAYHGALGSWGGEPEYTASTDRFVGACDYLLHASESLVPIATLSIPPLEALRGEDAREPLVVPDRATLGGAPRDWVSLAPADAADAARRAALATGDPDASAAELERHADAAAAEAAAAAEEHYSGEFVPYVVENELRPHSWLPNDDYPSEHMALLAVFDWSPDELIAHWA